MTTARRISAGLIVAAFWISSQGCAGRPVPLVNLTGSGEQWVWPYFLEGKPTVLAFWNTDTMECLRNVPALSALDAREGSVELVTVVTGRDRLEIDTWIRRDRIRYVVLLDQGESLARQLGVEDYPTFIYLDTRGKEVDRVTDIRLVSRWYYPRWLERSGAIAPTTARQP